jgi:hypothetical protein
MSRLVCDAVNCGNNHDRLCCLDEIEVCGCDACTCEGTCCGSFVDGKNEYISSFADVSASEDTHIGCEAGACVFNLDGICEADRVKMEGEYAHRMDSTCCGTFREEE